MAECRNVPADVQKGEVNLSSFGEDALTRGRALDGPLEEFVEERHWRGRPASGLGWGRGKECGAGRLQLEPYLGQGSGHQFVDLVVEGCRCFDVLAVEGVGCLSGFCGQQDFIRVILLENDTVVIHKNI